LNIIRRQVGVGAFSGGIHSIKNIPLLLFLLVAMALYYQMVIWKPHVLI
jgi:hypothetical protein